MKTPKQVYDAMMAQDAFSQWMDVQLIEIKSGYCKLSMVVRDDMLNGFKILHGAESIFHLQILHWHSHVMLTTI